MKRLTKIRFEYDDNSIELIDNQKAVLLFQSRCNSSGILSGLEEFIVEDNANKQELNK